jgi:hypothetical protein
LFFEFGWKVFFQVCLAIFSTIEVRRAPIALRKLVLFAKHLHVTLCKQTPLLRRSTSGEIFAFLSKVTWFHRHKVRKFKCSEVVLCAHLLLLKSDNDIERFFATARAFNVRLHDYRRTV